MTVLDSDTSTNTGQAPGVNLWSEVECFDGRVEREGGQVGVAPGKWRHPIIVSGAGYSPELLTRPEQPAGGELHVESPVALVAHHLVQIEIVTCIPWQSRGARCCGQQRDLSPPPSVW